MAEIPISDQEMALRRRARRRLVGAVALALSAIVVLPMVLDPEPKPLGPDVEVRIPAQDTPFVASQSALPIESAPAPQATPSMLNPVETAPPPQGAPLPVAKPAEPTQSTPVAEATKKPSLAKPAAKAENTSTKPNNEKPAEKVQAKGYHLQLGLFDKKANADKLVAQAKAAGFKAQANDDHGRWRVLVGPLAERAKAEEAQAKLKAKGLDTVLIAP